MPRPLNHQDRYMGGLDGLRALAVMAVIIYHLNPQWAPGGLLGVSVFFVLSGYLITDILLAKYERLGHFDLKDFWLRRARRLLPAMLIVLLVTLLWSLLLGREHLAALRGDIPAALLYISNWWFIFHNVSYFESFGPPSPLGHLWSLAVEEQFYLVWPIILTIALFFKPKKGRLAMIMLGGALISALIMAFMYTPGEDPSRVYYGTDTRVFSLLCGAGLAVVWPSRKLKPRVSKAASNSLDLIGLGALVLIGCMIWQTNEYQPFLYRGGLLLLSLITTIAVAALAHPASLLARLLSCAPLRWLGVRSYGLYLWHYPVIVMTTPMVSTGEVHPVRIILQVVFSIVLAALSWHYIEEPIRHGALGKLWHKGIKHLGKPRGRIHIIGGASLVLVLLLVSTYALYSIPTKVYEEANSATPTQAKVENHVKGAHANSAPANSAKAGQHTAVPKHMEPTPVKSVTAIGDSIMLDVQPFLEKRLPGIEVHGKVGRQMADATDVIQILKQNHKLGKTVIIELGTNGAFTDKQLDKLLTALADCDQLIFVNTRVPRPWQFVVNDMLEQAAKDNPKIKLVDWYAASAGKDEYFGHDGVHLMAEGAEAYTEIVAKALLEK